MGKQKFKQTLGRMSWLVQFRVVSGWGALCTLLETQNGHIDDTAGQIAWGGGVAMKSELPSPHFPQRLLHRDSTYQANLHTLLTSLKGVSHYNEGKKKWREEERRRKTYGRLSHISSYASLVAMISLHRGGPHWKHGQFHLGTLHG